MYFLPPPEAASTEYEISSPSDGSAVRAALLRRAPGTAPETETLPLTDAVSAGSTKFLSAEGSSSPKSEHDTATNEMTAAANMLNKFRNALIIDSPFLMEANTTPATF